MYVRVAEKNERKGKEQHMAFKLRSIIYRHFCCCEKRFYVHESPLIDMLSTVQISFTFTLHPMSVNISARLSLHHRDIPGLARMGHMHAIMCRRVFCVVYESVVS